MRLSTSVVTLTRINPYSDQPIHNVEYGVSSELCSAWSPLTPLIRSLDPQCTPLKHRYDSCFNLWFEGYLQPALDVRASTSLQNRLNNADNAAASRVSERRDEPAGPVQSAAPTAASRRPLVTSWSGAFRARGVSTNAPGSSSTSAPTPTSQATTYAEFPPSAIVSIDRRGKTRSQIKAEEYEAACGGLWRDYQGCLKVRSASRVQARLADSIGRCRAQH